MGATWAYSYNLAGMRTRAVDPDTGTSTTTYNHVGEKLTVVDARGGAGTLKYTYDQLGRVTKLIGGVGDKPIAEWTYDTLKPGLVTESRSFVAGDTANPFVQRITGYDTLGRPTGQASVIPANQGALAGTYSSSQTYTAMGQVATESLPGLGGLPAETITYRYTADGLPDATTGVNQYVNRTSYTPHGLPSAITGRENDTLVRTTVYDPETLAINGTYLNGATSRPQIQHMEYHRNPAGQITRTTQAMNFNNPAVERTMCYRYDTLARLTDAWTSSDDCAAAPSSTASTTTGAVPIWHQWEFDDAGTRTKQVKHKVSQLPAPDSTTTSTLGVAGHRHAVATDVTDGVTTSYSYDQAGNTVSATSNGVTENFTWDVRGKLTHTSKAGKTTSYVRDADGAIILRKDPQGTSVYTVAGEFRLESGVITGTRIYAHGGRTVAQRVGATTLQALDGDPLGTMSLAVDWGNLAKTTWRFLNPYGERINGIGAWATDRGMLNIPADPVTGYVQTGARLYNPATGRFLSVDPLLDPGQSQTLNGYSYTGGDPINTHDASGLLPTMNTIDNTGTTAQLVTRGGKPKIINPPPVGRGGRPAGYSSKTGKTASSRGGRKPGLPKSPSYGAQPSGRPNPKPHPPRPGENRPSAPINWGEVGRQVGGFAAGVFVTSAVIAGCAAASVPTVGGAGLACIAGAAGAGGLTTYAATCDDCNAQDAAIATAGSAVLGAAGGRIAQGANALRSAKAAPRSVVSVQLGQRPPGVPPTYVSEPARGAGVVWRQPGTQGDAGTVRIMAPNSNYRYGYVRFYNRHNQPVDLNGKPGGRPETHIPIQHDGSYQIPKGWPE